MLEHVNNLSYFVHQLARTFPLYQFTLLNNEYNLIEECHSQDRLHQDGKSSNPKSEVDETSYSIL